MTALPAAPAMTTLVEGVHPEALGGMPHVVARIVARIEVPTVVPTVVPAVILEAALIARDSAAVRCWHRRSRGCPSRRSPKA